MANRRMFSQDIVESDAFTEMPLSTQALYFHLGMNADDDGFVNSPKKIQRMLGASDNDLKLLIEKRFLLYFESGIIVIKHWKMNNYIQKDRYRETVYKSEKEQLYIKKNGAYTFDESKSKDFCIQNVYDLDTQCSVGKCSIDNTTLHNITLYYYYLIGKCENFENSTEYEKNIVITQLKNLNIYGDISFDNLITEEKRTEYILLYWAVKEILFSSHKVYIKYLTKDLLLDKFYKTCNYKNKNDTKNFLDYFIKTLKKEIQRISEIGGDLVAKRLVKI